MKKGDIIYFGNYPRDINGSKSTIEWLVLDVNENEALLISRYALDCKQYHSGESITWEGCDLRKWLNSDFLKSAFSNEESERILVSELKNENNHEYDTRGGNDTKDRIFCLSIAEAEQYFSSNKDRQCLPTAYARKQGAYVDNGCCYWWLRSPGYYQYRATNVPSGGALSLCGNFVFDDRLAVRPALRIIIDEGLETKQWEERERREQEDRIRIQREIQTFGIPLSSIRKGAFIKYGNYPQDINGSKSPIEWLVLDVNENENEALIISRYGLDCKQYHDVLAGITWEDCDLRKWLNNDFIKSAFSEEEAKKIKVSELKNEDNPEYRTRGGNNTKDRIFCLSITEAKQYFKRDNDRQCQPTTYAIKQGAYVNNDRCYCYWWLRSPGGSQGLAMNVIGGALNLCGCRVNFDSFAVRPALRIICNL